MNLNVSGSQDVHLSSMHFMKNGELILEGNPDTDASIEEMTSLMMTQDYIVYALTRDDWMMHFMEALNDKLTPVQEKISRSHLTVIDGGKSRKKSGPKGS